MENPRVSIIVATDLWGTIGDSKKPGGLPWPRLKEDMKHFVRTRKDKPVVIGRKSYELIARGFRPFKNSPTIIVSKTRDFSNEENSIKEKPYMAEGVLEAIEKASDLARRMGVDEVIIAGGEQIYREALAFDLVDRIYLTRVSWHFEGDAHFPMEELSRNWTQQNGSRPVSSDQENPYSMTFFVYNKKPR